VLLGLVLLLLLGLVVAALATLTRHPFTVCTLLLGSVAGLIVEAATHDTQLTTAVVLVLALGALALKAVADFVVSARPRREPKPRTAAEREAERQERRQRLAA
jgi:Na+-transporting methylmalonyl-CoA/oxaloacetate decarboxylase gamma subunit